MKFCKKCVMPDTRPGQEFDSEGVCDACRSAEEKDTIDWNARKKEFDQLISQHRGSKRGTKYDCIIGVSGGKDSTWQVHIIKEVCGLNPLCICFGGPYETATDTGKKNLENLNKMGVDLIHFKPNPKIYQKLCFESLKRIGDNDWPNHIGVFCTLPQFAIKFNIPLIIWGENPEHEFGGERELRNKSVSDKGRMERREGGGLHAEDFVSDEIKMEDLYNYIYPSDEELKRVGVKGLYLGYFFKWQMLNQIDYITKNCGWNHWEHPPREGTFTDYEDLDCDSMVIHEYLKYVKFGFGRATDHACNAIKAGRMTREEGVNLVNKYDGRYPHNAMKKLLKYHSITEEQFFEIIEPFVNKKLFKTDKTGKAIRDASKSYVRREECIVR